jgi:hypothetical protein
VFEVRIAARGARVLRVQVKIGVEAHHESSNCERKPVDGKVRWKRAASVTTASI